MDKLKRFSEITLDMYETYERKNADYGDSFGESVKELGIVAAITRISDKCNRLKSLVNNPAQVADESMCDTLLDLANYAVMTLIELSDDVEQEEKESVSINRFIELANRINIDDYNNVRHLSQSVQELWYRSRARHERKDINKLNDHIMACVIVIETCTMSEDEQFAFMVYITEKQSEFASMILMEELSND